MEMEMIVICETASVGESRGRCDQMAQPLCCVGCLIIQEGRDDATG